ncbi:hypothetical protein QTP86_026451, partial [Hemibagrus guttatus]
MSWNVKSLNYRVKRKKELKELFTSASILTLPDPTRQFIVEVDASNLGVGVVLSQHNPRGNRLHPCAFFSHRLTPVEQNYSAGERELLGIKLALEEWHHWLEGAELPFIVWTDHKNLEYLQTAKSLNPRQACWVLFFGRFRFALSYLPGAKNGKPVALSCQFTAMDEGPTVEPLRSQVLQWCHNSRLFCHPRTTSTMAVSCFDHVHPFMETLFPDGCGLFQQDNAPCHKAEMVQEWFDDHNNQFEELTPPPNSPDLNPIQHLWDVLDKQVRSMEAITSQLTGLKGSAANILVSDPTAHLQGSSGVHASMGIFTAPVKGVYYFTFVLFNPNNLPTGVALMKNTESIVLATDNEPGADTEDTATNSVSLLLEEGDQVYMELMENRK